MRSRGKAWLRECCWDEPGGLGGTGLLWAWWEQFLPCVSPVGRSWSWAVVGMDGRAASGKEQKFLELFCSVGMVMIWSFPLPRSLGMGGVGSPLDSP